MTAEDVFGRISAALETAGIPFMLTGSFAGMYHGVIRSTQDIDIVIVADAFQLRTLVRLLPKERYYVDEETALEALRTESMFNVIDFATGWKIDLIIGKSGPFDREKFNRRFPTTFQGTGLFMSTREDLLISKLEWAKSGESERQIEDVALLLRVQEGNLDETYVEKWVQALGLDFQWRKARRAAGLPEGMA